VRRAQPEKRQVEQQKDQKALKILWYVRGDHVAKHGWAQGRRQKNFQGGNEEKRPKIAILSLFQGEANGKKIEK